MTGARGTVLLALALIAAVGLVAAGALGLLRQPAPPGSIAPAMVPDLPPAGAPLRLLVAGTSLTARGDWPERLAADLAGCRVGPVSVERVARAGATSRWGEPALLARLARGPAPHLVLIEFSVNDAVLPRLVPLSESRRRIMRMAKAAQAAGALPLLVTMSELHGRERWERPGLAAHRALYADIARKTGAGLIDTLPPWRALSRQDLSAAVPDGAHPTPEAMAALLVPALAGALRPYACPP
jgi:lysophospholipase L1-like esterase